MSPYPSTIRTLPGSGSGLSISMFSSVMEKTGSFSPMANSRTSGSLREGPISRSRSRTVNQKENPDFRKKKPGLLHLAHRLRRFFLRVIIDPSGCPNDERRSEMPSRYCSGTETISISPDLLVRYRAHADPAGSRIRSTHTEPATACKKNYAYDPQTSIASHWGAK